MFSAPDCEGSRWRQIRAHGRNFLPRADFPFDTERDLSVCPGGKELREYRRAFSTPREGVAKDGAIRYRAAQHGCDAGMLKLKPCPNNLAGKIARSVHEAARRKARAIEDRGRRRLMSRTNHRVHERRLGQVTARHRRIPL
jgi:hypothetical protein